MKKIIVTYNFNYNPTSGDTMSEGFNVGQWWRNDLTGDIFYHKLDGYWLPIDLQKPIMSPTVPDIIFEGVEWVDTTSGIKYTYLITDGVSSWVSFNTDAIAYDYSPTLDGGGASDINFTSILDGGNA